MADAPKSIYWIINEVGSLKVVLEELKTLESTWSDPGPSNQGEYPQTVLRHPSAMSSAGDSSGLSISMPGIGPTFPLKIPDVDRPGQLDLHYRPRKEVTPMRFDHSALLKCLGAAHGPPATCQSALRTIHDKIAISQPHGHPARVFIWPLKEQAVQKILGFIQRQKSNLILALAADETRAISKITESLVHNVSLTSEVLETLVKKEEKTPQVINTIQDSDAAKEYEKIIKWLQSTGPSANQVALWGRHEPNTGNWFLDSRNFDDWKAVAGHFAWLNGISGCGKTVLCASVIEHMRDYCVNKSDCEYAYYYVDFTDPKKCKNAAMVRNSWPNLLAKGEIFHKRSSTFTRTMGTEPRSQDLQLLPQH